MWGDLSSTHIMLYVFDWPWFLFGHLLDEKSLPGMILRFYFHIVRVVVPFIIIPRIPFIFYFHQYIDGGN